MANADEMCGVFTVGHLNREQTFQTLIFLSSVLYLHSFLTIIHYLQTLIQS